jgi:uncharacterized protein (DUF3084 family)
MSTENLKYPFATAAAKVETFEALNEGLWITAEALQNMENNLAAHAAQVDALNATIAENSAAIEAANATIASNNETIIANNARIAELESEVAKLKAGPAATLTTTTSDKDDVGANSVIGSDPINAEAERLRAIKAGKF